VISRNLKVVRLAFGGDCFTILIHMTMICKREACFTVSSAFFVHFVMALLAEWCSAVCGSIQVVEFDGILYRLIERPLILLY
jgi:hypothetical protein